MTLQRVVCFVDGLNFYHFLHSTGKNSLKWVNLDLLFTQYINPNTQRISHTFFFTTYAHWKPQSYQRHLEYVAALSTLNVTSIIGRFSTKHQKCHHCHSKWTSHHEKETDVNLAISILDLAHKDTYDHAFVLSRDTDIAPAINKVKEGFPSKKITVLTPCIHKLARPISDKADHHILVRIEHIAKALFPAYVYDQEGKLVATRPPEYSPLK